MAEQISYSSHASGSCAWCKYWHSRWQFNIQYKNFGGGSSGFAKSSLIVPQFSSVGTSFGAPSGS